VESTVKLDASSLPGAVAKAAREFVKSLDRKQRFDMNRMDSNTANLLARRRRRTQKHPREPLLTEKPAKEGRGTKDAANQSLANIAFR